jgi:hypothetical protein
MSTAPDQRQKRMSLASLPYALGVSEPTGRQASRTARVRIAHTVAPELLALTLLYLACFAAERQFGFPGVQQERLGLLALASPVLLIVGGWLLCLSRRLTWVTKTVGIGTAIVFPLALVTHWLTGWNEICDSGSQDNGGTIVNSYSRCQNGPNGVTHTVEWIWTLAPLAILIVLVALIGHRYRQSAAASNSNSPALTHQ